MPLPFFDSTTFLKLGQKREKIFFGGIEDKKSYSEISWPLENLVQFLYCVLWRNHFWIFFQCSRYDQASCFLTEAVINAFNAKRAKLDEGIENSDKKKDDSDTSSIKITSDEVKLYDALACVVLSTKNSRQPWALEMLVKVLKQVITSKNTLPMFKSACHSDLKNILPEMAQLQWTLHGNAGIKMISSCPSCQFLGKFNFLCAHWDCENGLKNWKILLF